LVEALVVDVFDDGCWQQVFDGHASPNEQPDFCGADIVVDELLDDKDIAPVLVKDVVRQQELVHVRSCPFEDQAPVLANDVVELVIDKARINKNGC